MTHPNSTSSWARPSTRSTSTTPDRRSPADGPGWRLIIDEPRTGPSNMALDHALFEGVQVGGQPVLRLYRWAPACLSFGRNQIAAGIYDPARARRDGIDIVRRPTGGLAVYHDQELTYSVAVPVGTVGRPRATYAAINRALALGLRRMGAPVDVATGTVPPRVPIGVAANEPVPQGRTMRLPNAGMSAVGGDSRAVMADTRHPCFHGAAPGEVVARGRKLVGSAVRLERHTILQHGSILLDGDQSDVVRLQKLSVGADDGGADVTAAGQESVGLSQVLGRTPAWSELYDAVRYGFREYLGVAPAAATYTTTELERARTLEDRYGSDAWTWRK